MSVEPASRRLSMAPRMAGSLAPLVSGNGVLIELPYVTIAT